MQLEPGVWVEQPQGWALLHTPALVLFCHHRGRNLGSTRDALSQTVLTPMPQAALVPGSVPHVTEHVCVCVCPFMSVSTDRCFHASFLRGKAAVIAFILSLHACCEWGLGRKSNDFSPAIWVFWKKLCLPAQLTAPLGWGSSMQFKMCCCSSFSLNLWHLVLICYLNVGA